MSKLLWLSWKDYRNPQAGGAEVVGHEIRTRFARDGHEVIHVTSMFPGAKAEEMVDGVKTIRLNSSKFFLSWTTYRYYKKNLKNWADFIVEEVNTAPYFARLYKGKEKLALLYHQLTGIVWDYETSFPMNVLGKYLIEPVALWVNSKHSLIITISESSKDDLLKHGFSGSNVRIVPLATDLPFSNTPRVQRNLPFTVSYYGSLRTMKRPEDVIKGFASSLKGTSARLMISGRAAQAREQYLITLIKELGIEAQTDWIGYIPNSEKPKFMGKNHLLCMTSVKEGWGIVAMEAGLYGAPSLVYDVDGLRDAVINKKTGIHVTDGDFAKLGEAMKFCYEHPDITAKMGTEARKFNEQFNFDRTYEEFKKLLG